LLMLDAASRQVVPEQPELMGDVLTGCLDAFFWTFDISGL